MFKTVAIAGCVVAVAAGAALAAESASTAPKGGAASYRGKAIDVSGHLNVLGEIATLGVDAGAPHTILVELANLSREQRQILISRCSEGCEVHVTGKSGSVLRDPGVIATDLRLIDGVPSKMASRAD